MTSTILKHCRFFFFALLMTTLVGCAAQTGGSSWGMPSGNSGIVTSDPNQLPDVAWQTASQREGLMQQNNTVATSTTPTPAAAPVPPREIKVALLLPLTGKNANLGKPMLQASQLALFDVGSSGFELIPADTGSTPQGAAAAAQKAIAGGASLLLGPIFADDVKAVKPIASAASIPMVSFTTDWTLADNNTYIFGFLPFLQVARVTQFAETKGLGNLGVVAPQTEYADVVIATLDRTGATAKAMQRYSPGQPDLNTIIADFASRQKSADGSLAIDSLLLPVGGESLRSLTAVLSQHGLSNKRLRLLGTGLWDDSTALSDPALTGGWFAAPDPKARRDFEQRYQQNFGGVPPRLATLAYDATALAAVLSRTDTTGEPYSRNRMTAARGFAGIDGVFRFRGDGLAERGLAVLEIRGGSASVIDPAPTAFGSGS